MKRHLTKLPLNPSFRLSFILLTTTILCFFRQSVIVNSFSAVSLTSTNTILRASKVVRLGVSARSPISFSEGNFSTFGVSSSPAVNNFSSYPYKFDLKASKYSQLEKLTVVQLKELLRERSLKVSGRKADLIQRLQSEDQDQIVTMPRRSKRKSDDADVDTKVKNDGAAENVENVENNETSNTKSKGGKTKKAKVDHQRITERDEIKKLWDEDEALMKGSYTFKIMSLNVAGLRAFLRKQPEALSKLAAKHNLDVICLQETKLQESHLDDPKLNIKGVLKDDGFDSHYSCSTTKKGYSGTCIFVRRRQKVLPAGGDNDDGQHKDKGKKKQGKLDSFFSKKKKPSGKKDGHEGEKANQTGEIDVANLIPINVSMGMGKEEHDSEGRMITIDFPEFSITNVYVPNSGQKLERLDYRTKNWDKDFLHFMKEREDNRNKPVIWLGDLNVAHTSKDVWNDGAKHLAKQAGVTAEERESFQEMLDFRDGSFVDAFRYLHPDTMGHYSYWSQRAGNREPNKGLRLDYFICSASLMKDEPEKKAVVRDSYMIKDQEGSDHCPVVLEIEMRK